MAAATVLKFRGAFKIYIVATHGLLSGDAPALIEESCIDQVCYAAKSNRREWDSIPLPLESMLRTLPLSHFSYENANLNLPAKIKY